MNDSRLHITKLNSKENNPSIQVEGFKDFNKRTLLIGQILAFESRGQSATNCIGIYLGPNRNFPWFLQIFLDACRQEKERKTEKAVRAFRSWRTECARPKRGEETIWWTSGEKERERGVREAYWGRHSRSRIPSAAGSGGSSGLVQGKCNAWLCDCEWCLCMWPGMGADWFIRERDLWLEEKEEASNQIQTS